MLNGISVLIGFLLTGSWLLYRLWFQCWEMQLGEELSHRPLSQRQLRSYREPVRRRVCRKLLAKLHLGPKPYRLKSHDPVKQQLSALFH